MSDTEVLILARGSMPAMRILLLSLLLAACPTNRPEGGDDYEGDEPGECADGADNDQDGDYDCDDEDCASAPDCTADDDDVADDDDTAPDDDDTTPDDDDTAPDDDDAADDDDASPVGAFIYAHTATTLYEVDPEPPYTATSLGNFSGQNILSQGVTDIGVDLLGTMWGVGFFEIYEVNPNNGALTERQFDLSFGEMNAMTVLADGSVLAGAQNRLYSVDAVTGQATVLQTLTGYNFAGDMVGLPDGLLYMLMCVGTTPPCATTVVAMDLDDLSFWEVGPTGHGDMYGVAYHNGNGLIYGFTGSGELLLIDPATGIGTSVSTGGPQWWGATTNPARWSG